MKTINSKISDIKAKRELEQFSLAAIIFSLISMVIFWWLAIAGLIFAVRSLVLSVNVANKKRVTTTKYRIIALSAAFISLVVIFGRY
ncbi:hypothetical protein CYG49_00275 [Candidatus Saccharibacteria bacterium]|nr:MAG: hypothetical protein CYG49_00275 [Candidatus Saccharibacteria bacterium]